MDENGVQIDLSGGDPNVTPASFRHKGTLDHRMKVTVGITWPD